MLNALEFSECYTQLFCKHFNKKRRTKRTLETHMRVLQISRDNRTKLGQRLQEIQKHLYFLEGFQNPTSCYENSSRWNFHRSSFFRLQIYRKLIVNYQSWRKRPLNYGYLQKNFKKESDASAQRLRVPWNNQPFLDPYQVLAFIIETGLYRSMKPRRPILCTRQDLVWIISATHNTVSWIIVFNLSSSFF